MKNQTKEIMWNVINSLLAGGLVLFGSFATGEITIKGLIFAGCAAAIVALTQFKDYWKSQEGEYKSVKLFSFIH